MQSRQYSQTKNIQKQTSAFSIPPVQGMFESRPFVVQQQTTEKSQLPDLKTSLMQAERYGHHFDRIYPTELSAATGLQPNHKMGKPIKSDAVNKPQVLQPARLNSVFAGQAMNSTLSSQPIQLVRGKEERQNAKKFNEQKKKELEKIKHADKEPTDYKGFKKKGKKGKNNNPVTDKFAKDHVVPAGNSMSNASSSVAHKRTWGRGKTSGKSTLVGMSKQDVKDEQRYAIEGRKMSETDFNDTGSIAPKMGVNKETKFAYENQTSTVTSDKHGNRKVTKGKKELGHPVLGMRGDQIHHLQGIQDIEDN
ncbi:hypothetical protein [Nostoc sp.]|uniref:hypothetical protein n=1 Tax=Nostoc sp. TaxID=1180 RepID=UPI002FF4BA61